MIIHDKRYSSTLTRKDSITPFSSEGAGNGLQTVLRTEIVVLVHTFRGGLACHTGDLEQELTEQQHRAVTNTPVVIEETLLQFGHEEGNGCFGIAVHNALTRLQRRVSNEFRFISQTLDIELHTPARMDIVAYLEDRWDDLAQVGNELLSETDR